MLVLLLALVIGVIDQATKYFIRMSFALGESRPVVEGFASLTHVKNTGAAWGILGEQNAWLIVISLALLIAMILFRRSFLSGGWEHRVSLGLLVGGVVGNLMDRIRLGGVTDFLDFHWRGYHWPAFNVADSAICIGVGLYIISALWISSHPLHESRLKGGATVEGKGEDATA